MKTVCVEDWILFNQSDFFTKEEKQLSLYW